MKYQKLLEQTYQEVQQIPQSGTVASYIPELAKVSSEHFAAHLCTVKGGSYSVGSYATKFSIQSIAKVFTISLAFEMLGDEVWQRVGVEPSGDPFNSLVQLEYENGIPRNPFINAGALVVADILLQLLDDPWEEFLFFIRKLAGNDRIAYNEKVVLSESQHGFKNRALVNLMKSFSNIRNDLDKVLDFYFHVCSIEMSCEELAKTFLIYARHGKCLLSDERVLAVRTCKRINAIMQTCGFYDEAGEFSFRVGLPGKSGVGGGIAACHPHKYSIAVWSPPLNPKGNSFKGMKFLELFTSKSELSIF
ncbi:MAG: glutaminase [Spirochaetota bacterium]